MHPERNLIVLLLLVAMLAQSGPEVSDRGAESGTPTGSAPVTLPDCSGQPVTFDHVPERIVTLDAYAAEFVIDLGFGDRIVGTGYPYPDAQIPDDLRDDYTAIPVLADLVPSRGGDRRRPTRSRPDRLLRPVRDRRRVRGIRTMSALSEPSRLPHAGDSATTTVSDIEFTYTFFEELGQILGVPDRADGIVTDLRDRQASIVSRYAGETPTRVFADATDPNDGQPIPTWGGASLPNGIMTLAGCTNIFGDVDDDGVVPSAEEVAARDPEVLIIVSDFSTLTGDELIAGDPGEQRPFRHDRGPRRALRGRLACAPRRAEPAQPRRCRGARCCLPPDRLTTHDRSVSP